MRTILISSLLAAAAGAWSQPSIEYTLRIDPRHLDIVEVAIRIDHAPDTVRLAMKVHPEYDARYWRYLDSLHVDGVAVERGGGVTRADKIGRASCRERV